MTLTTVNRSFEKIGSGELYIAALPASITATTVPAAIEEYFALFYADGGTRKALKAGVLPWAALTSDGIKTKIKANTIEVDPNSGPKHVVGIQDMEVTFEINIIDITAAKLAELASCSSDELIADAAASGSAGRSTVLLGGQSQLTNYVLLYRMPSKLWPGEYDNILFLRVNFTIDTDFDLSKKSVLTCKVKGSALQEAYGKVVNAAGVAEQMLYDVVTAAATA